MYTWTTDNVDELYTETLSVLEMDYILEKTRGGEVWSFQRPVMWTLTNPRNRVLINETRDANPFFHVMEFVWMMSGEGRIDWITQFSKNYGKYAADGAGYGWRWRNHFRFDQISQVIEILQKDPNTRRAVLQMWDGPDDLTTLPKKEVPCNTHIYFRVLNGHLDMTVLNRSNDIIWGALGANVVHMTMLHELIAFETGLKLGWYQAFSNNAHVYTSVSRFGELFLNKYDGTLVEQCRPLLREGESWRDFVVDCEEMVKGESPDCRTEWMREVAWPIHNIFKHRAIISDLTETIQCPAWRKACELWLSRRKK